MTEAEWLACTDPDRMLDFLSGKVSDRKLQLFAVGWCLQRVSGSLEMTCHAAGGGTDQLSEAGNATVAACRYAVETTERLADGQSSEAERIAAEAALRRLPDWGNWDLLLWYMRALSLWAVSTGGQHRLSLPPEAPYAAGSANARNAHDRSHQAILLRDIFRGPLRSVTFLPAWLTPTVISLARTIYDQRAFERMPELADALETAGCNDAQVLGHCKEPGPHVRGCWLVDIVLGKE